MTSTAFILEKIKRLQSSESAHDVVCSVCQLPLTDAISKEAGKGPICSRRMRFTEKLSRDQLNEMRGQDINLLEGNIVKSVILKPRSDQQPRFVTIVSQDQNNLDYWDHNDYDAFYEKGDSVTDSIMKSWQGISHQNIEFASTLSAPKSKDFADSLRLFEGSYKEELNSRDSDVKSDSVAVQSKKFLDKKQLQDRTNIIKNYRTEDNEEFKEKLYSGEYPIATLMSRLAGSKIEGSKDLLDVLQKNYSYITPKDHGLTDDDMTLFLTHASKPIEKKIYVAVIKGKAKLDELARAYTSIKENSKSLENYKKFNDLTS
jgi:hypothetical protein